MPEIGMVEKKPQNEQVNKGTIFVVSAPSGAGKTTICNMAVDFSPGLKHSISYTTRPPRTGEKNGVQYWFTDDATFDRMIKDGEFLEYAGVFGKRYGTSRKDLESLVSQGVDVLLEIDVQGAENVRGKLPEATFIFVLPPSVKECEKRLKLRGKDSDAEIERRLKTAVGEIKKAPEYDYIIINEDLNAAFETFKSIIIAEKSNRANMLNAVIKIFGEYL